MAYQIYIDEILKAFDFNEADDPNILDFLEKEGVEMHSHCRAGFCGTCRVNLIRGEVYYSGGLPLACLREGEILPCCCVPTSDIEIKTY